jgi:hypothetical protein
MQPVDTQGIFDLYVLWGKSRLRLQPTGLLRINANQFGGSRHLRSLYENGGGLAMVFGFRLEGGQLVIRETVRTGAPPLAVG